MYIYIYSLNKKEIYNMKQFNQFEDAYNNQQERGNERYSGVSLIDDIPFVIRHSYVLWLIMDENSYLGDYDEYATEYGVAMDGRWAAVSNGHCSCNGWEATVDDITYYSSLSELLMCDSNANVILKYKEALVNLYPFLAKYF